MKGFLNTYHNGHRCFIRDDYEYTHIGEDELQRIEDALGMTFSSVNDAMYYALMHARYLLYRCESDDIDFELLRGRDKWEPFNDGYVHVVTGEFVNGFKPDRDSYPCWRLSEPRGSYLDSGSAVKLSGAIGMIAAACEFLATLLGGK